MFKFKDLEQNREKLISNIMRTATDERKYFVGELVL